MRRTCPDCQMSLIALEAVGVTHNDKTGQCSRCYSLLFKESPKADFILIKKNPFHLEKPWSK